MSAVSVLFELVSAVASTGSMDTTGERWPTPESTASETIHKTKVSLVLTCDLTPNIYM